MISNPPLFRSRLEGHHHAWPYFSYLTRWEVGFCLRPDPGGDGDGDEYVIPPAISVS